MKNIFDKDTASEIQLRIHQLTPESQALWGKMNVSQMLSHCQVPIEVATGDKSMKRTLIGLLFGGIAKKKLVNEKPFSVNLPTDPSFIRKGVYDFNEEKEKLIQLINRLVTAGEKGLSQLPHPFFGKLSAVEWRTLLYKHLDHHLRQFGV